MSSVKCHFLGQSDGASRGRVCYQRGLPCPTCHMSHVLCHMSHVMCHMSFVTIFFLGGGQVVILFGGGSVINVATPSSFKRYWKMFSLNTGIPLRLGYISNILLILSQYSTKLYL